MSHYKPYPAYKDSGVEWLGRVPEHWDILPLKSVVTFRSGGTPSKDNLDFWDGDIPWASAKDLKKEQLEDTQDHLTELAVTSGAASLVAAGSVLVVVRGMILARTFPVVEAMVPMAINQDLKALQALQALDEKFLAYLLRGLANESLRRLEEAGHGTKALRMELWTSMQLTIPPKEEQQSISTYLARETARIDALVAKKTRFIELLREKRQALITHAVTKGLDPNVKMKDSGVEWLGEVPEHWGISPLKYLVRFRSGGTPSKDNLEFWDGDIPWASAKDLKQEMLADTIDHLTGTAIESGAASLVPPGSILVVVRGMILARLFPVVETLVPMAINQDLKALVPSESLNSRYLAHLLRGSSAESLSRLEEAGHGTKALRMENWVSIELPAPPLHEQLAIIAMLDIQTARIDSLSEKTERSIDLLKERRSALITAAVTGQIDLREAV